VNTMTITPKQKKTFSICAAALAVIYYAPAVITRVDRSVSAGSASPTVTPQVSAAVVAAAPFRGMVGTFFARGPLPGRGICGFKFELRHNLEKPGTFKGYVTLTCMPFAPRQWRPNMVAASGTKTMSAILTGLPEPGGIRFHVDDAFNTTGGCSPKAFVLKPFGLNQVVTEWEDSCGSGAMTLPRTGR
jgi:hypothetical protein